MILGTERMVYGMVRNLLLTILACMIPSCASKGIKLNQRWEGIDKGKLRVYVRISLPEMIDDEKQFEKQLEKQFDEKSDNRAVHLIVSYIRANLTDPSEQGIFNSMILKIVKEGKIAFRHCTDDYCEIFKDYNAKVFLEKFEKYKKKKAQSKKATGKEPAL